MRWVTPPKQSIGLDMMPPTRILGRFTVQAPGPEQDTDAVV